MSEVVGCFGFSARMRPRAPTHARAPVGTSGGREDEGRKPTAEGLFSETDLVLAIGNIALLAFALDVGQPHMPPRPCMHWARHEMLLDATRPREAEGLADRTRVALSPPLPTHTSPYTIVECLQAAGLFVAVGEFHGRRRACGSKQASDKSPLSEAPQTADALSEHIVASGDVSVQRQHSSFPPLAHTAPLSCHAASLPSAPGLPSSPT